MLPHVLRSVGFLNEEQMGYVKFARANPVEYGDVTKGLPIVTGSADILYSSHMIGYLDQQDALLFLKEARRVLRHGGVLRLAAPDLQMRVHQYLERNDADAFIESTILTSPRPRTFAKRLVALFLGPRNHQWMYDGRSLSRLLESQGFLCPQIRKAGETQISNFQPLDLFEKADESVYVEAVNP
jgi:predicted SAM-dependent methyltransferase